MMSFLIQSFGVPRFIVLQLLSGLTPTYETVIDALNNGFVQNWTHVSDFGKYFEQCSPTQCTYFQLQTTPIIEAVSVVIGLLGGLSISLRLFVEACTSIVSFFFDRCHLCTCSCACCCCCCRKRKATSASAAVEVCDVLLCSASD